MATPGEQGLLPRNQEQWIALGASADKIEIQALLGTVKELLTLFDLLGGAVFGRVKADIQGNVDKAERNIPPGAVTVADAFRAECDSKKEKKDDSFSIGILWMCYALQFTLGILRHVVGSPALSAGEAARLAYKESLEKQHNFMLRQLFKGLLSAAIPPRDVLVTKVLEPESPDLASTRVDEFLAVAQPVVDSLVAENPAV
mmetsp:Transcript_13151/g.29218  ORF Transcript_13151/g.29218 Transcript_13151/m.29218 type:complete len:201 (-) Transcript_13151:27-629(-)